MKILTKCLVCGYKGPFVSILTDCIELQDIKHEYSISVCEKCGFAFQNPQLTEQDLEKYYESNLLASGHVFSEYKNGTREYAKVDEIKKFLFRQLPGTKYSNKKFQLLEIGAGSGKLAGELVKSENISVSTYDLSVHSKINGAVTYSGKTTPPINSFDCVMAISVLEHVADPKLFIKQCRQYLTKEGILILEIPDSLRWRVMINNFFTWEHLWHFCLQTFAIFLEGLGGVIVDFELSRLISNIRVAVKFDSTIEANNKKKLMTHDQTPASILGNLSEFNREWISFKNKISDKIIRYLKTYNRIAIFGSGQHTLALFRLCPELKSTVVCFADNDVKKIGKEFMGKPISSANDLYKKDIDAILISSANYETEIVNGLPDNLEASVPILTIYT